MSKDEGGWEALMEAAKAKSIDVEGSAVSGVEHDDGKRDEEDLGGDEGQPANKAAPEPDDGDDDEPLSPEEYKKRLRQSGGAIKEERTKRKAEEAARKAAEEKAAIVERNFNALMDRLAGGEGAGAKKPEAAAEPNLQELMTTDPRKALELVAAKADATEKTLKETRQQQEQQVQVQQAVKAISAKMEAAEKEYLVEQPDYHEAADHYLKARAGMLKAAGMDADQAQAQIIQELLVGSAQAFQRGDNPPALLYEAAKACGYVPKAGGGGQGGDALAKVRDGQASARSLSNGGGAAPRRSANDKRGLLEISDPAEFSSKMDEFLKRQKRA